MADSHDRGAPGTSISPERPERRDAALHRRAVRTASPRRTVGTRGAAEPSPVVPAGPHPAVGGTRGPSAGNGGPGSYPPAPFGCCEQKPRRIGRLSRLQAPLGVGPIPAQDKPPARPRSETRFGVRVAGQWPPAFRVQAMSPDTTQPMPLDPVAGGMLALHSRPAFTPGAAGRGGAGELGQVSVRIGFRLQNIVNNFVSGLISRSTPPSARPASRSPSPSGTCTSPPRGPPRDRPSGNSHRPRQ